MKDKKRTGAWASLFLLGTTSFFFAPLGQANQAIYNPLNPEEEVQPVPPGENQGTDDTTEESTVPQQEKKMPKKKQPARVETPKKEPTKKAQRQGKRQKKRLLAEILAEKPTILAPSYDEGTGGGPPAAEERYYGQYFSLLCGTLLFGRVGDQNEQ